MTSNDRATNKFKAGVFTGRFFLYLFLIILAILCFTPFYIMIINATRSTQQINLGVSLLPSKALVENYRTMMNSLNIWRGFLNSMIIAVPSTILAGYFGALTAYAFSKFRFKGNRILFWAVLGTMMIPAQLGIVGYYQLTVKLHLIDTYWALILPTIASASTVFFLKMYIDANVDYALIEAARVDGSSEFRTFNKIVLPIAMPGIATMCILNFMFSWNNYFTPLVLLFDKNKFTLPILITLVKGTFKQNIGSQYLAVTIAVVPILIAFTLFSKYIIGGIAAGALKE
ncbi:MAG TPA: carbohydrate ABC transporter permease [Clostridia bacterium]|nr:carbohydrate ABC transporter permease [Clostridia bacterium]